MNADQLRKRCLDVLELRAEATQGEINAAYHALRALYGGKSIALMPLDGEYNDEKRKEILARIEEAYRWLADNPPVRNEQQEGKDKLAATPAIPEPSEYTGAELKRIREALKLDILEIEQRTRIARRHLKNIEEDNYGALPEPVFVRGYVEAYARQLGLDRKRAAEQYMARYKQAMGGGSGGNKK